MDKLKVVVIGGGTGLSILLRGLKLVAPNITAVVTVADDGGGSGLLREDLGMLPPGDIRNCILALASCESIMAELLQYRFTEGRLKGQNFGNLLIAAMLGISANFEEAIHRIHEILAVTGRVLPVTNEDIHLCATLKNGGTVVGESNIPYEALRCRSSIEKVYLSPNGARAFPRVVDEIMDCDIVLLGPGSLYTSIIPNILVREVDDALAETRAKKVYICNIMTQPGETDGMSVSDHISAFLAHSNHKYIDFVAVNTGSVDSDTLTKYESQGSKSIMLTDDDIEFAKSNGIGIIADDFTEVKMGYLRHDAEKLSRAVVSHIFSQSDRSVGPSICK
jgi:uncharacterized cofD-like protein